MKLFVILSVIACGYAAKLDRTYLPPPNAATAGGNPDSLVAPFGSPTGFGQSPASGRIGTASQDFGSPPGPSGFGQSSPSGNFGPARQSSLGSPSGPSGFRQSPAPGNIGSTSQGVFGSPSGPSGFGQSSPSGNYGPAKQSSLGSSSGPSGFGQSPAFGNLGPAKQGSFGQLQSGFSKPGLEASSQGFEQGSASNQPAFGASQNSFPNVGPRGSDNFAPQQEFANQPERAQAGADRSAETLKYINENDGETFNYSFETSNGITAEENGIATHGVQAQGAFSYMGDDGQKYSVAYTADENGYQPQGEHLPTPHPIPEEILKSIEKNSQAAAAGTQEGAYNPEEDIESGPSPQQYNAPSAFGQQPSGPSKQYGAATAAFNQAPQGNYNQGPSSSFQSRPVQSFFGPSSPAQSTFPSIGSTQSAFAPAGPSQSAFAPTSSAQSAFNPSRPAQSSFAQSGPAQPSFASSGPAQSAFTPSRPVAGPASPNQFNRPNSASFRQPASQNALVSQQQDESGYKYNRPSGPRTSFGGSAQSASPAPGSVSFGNAAPQTFPGRSTTAFGSVPVAQSSFGGRPSSPVQGSFNRQPSSPQQYNTGPNNGFQATRPSAPQQYRGQQSAAPRTPMPEYQSAPYQYNQPEGQGQLSSRIASPSQSGSASQQPSSPFNPLATQTFNQAGQSTQSQNFNQAAQGQSQAFGGPRQPPSFSPEEGYKY